MRLSSQGCFSSQKRLVIGLVAALGIAAFGLIPTDQLQIKPDKPMYFYVVPLLRIKVRERYITTTHALFVTLLLCRTSYLSANRSSRMLIGENLCHHGSKTVL
jgi:hypothetical protein